MSHNTEETLTDLRDENLELKLDSLRKEQAITKTDMHRHLDVAIEAFKSHIKELSTQVGRVERHVEKTNGSVARAMEKINTLERQENKKRIEDLLKELNTLKEDTSTVRMIKRNKWVGAMIVAFLYAFAISEFRSALLDLLKIF